MDLWCSEKGDDCATVLSSSSSTSTGQYSNDDDGDLATLAMPDHVLLSDARVLQRLVQAEQCYTPVDALKAYDSIQTQIKPHMRKILANWMMEVCEELKCDDVVLPLAINYVDRILSCTRIEKNQLQLLGAVCLLIASKMRQFQSIHPETLVFYADYSVTIEDLINWELFVLTQLKWDVSAVVAIDYLDHLFDRLTISQQHLTSNLNKTIIETIRRRASTFIALCSTEIQFASISPSIIAAASVAVAVDASNWENKPWKSVEQVISLLERISNINYTTIENCVNNIEELKPNIKEISNLNTSKSIELLPSMHKHSSQIASKTVIMIIETNGQPETPTDIQDIVF